MFGEGGRVRPAQDMWLGSTHWNVVMDVVIHDLLVALHSEEGSGEGERTEEGGEGRREEQRGKRGEGRRRKER